MAAESKGDVYLAVLNQRNTPCWLAGGVITEESLGPESSSGGRSSEAAHTGRSQRMVRRVIDADNSCLFNAIGCVLILAGLERQGYLGGSSCAGCRSSYDSCVSRYLMERDLKSGSRLRRLIAVCATSISVTSPASPSLSLRLPPPSLALMDAGHRAVEPVHLQ